MSAPVLVCFALEGEAKPFRMFVRYRPDVRVLVTGMAQRNTERAIQAALLSNPPRMVFTCGVAGALDPALKVGDVLFHTRDENLAARLASAGARDGVITCEDHVAVTRAQKAALRERTGADAVEMESAFIQSACSAVGLPCATVRAISDAAHDDLPLDFNLLWTSGQKLSPAKLALAILRAPQKIPALMRLGRSSAFAARQLAQVLSRVI
jgi:adenosylhomocysteine nucleosidase